MASWRISDGTYKGFTFHVAIPNTDSPFGVVTQEEQEERRLQVSEKPMINGGEVDDFGAKPRVFSAEIVFFGADYVEQLKAFKDVLNQGTTGILVLPDLAEAVYAKYQKMTRRTTAAEGTCTVLNVSWIEDRTTKVQTTTTNNAQAAQAALASGNIAQAIPTIQEQSNSVIKFAQGTQKLLTNNALLRTLRTAENAVVNTTSTINAVQNIPRNLRQTIISTYTRINNEISNLQSVVNGLKNFSELLNLGLTQSNPTRFNSGLGAVDFQSVDTATPTIVSGALELVKTQDEVTQVQSFDEAKALLEQSSAAIQEGRKDLEKQTSGNTADFTTSSIQLENSVKDLIAILETRSTTKVLTNANHSLLEVCFENGLGVSDIDRIYKLNTHIDDILDIPKFTVINL